MQMKKMMMGLGVGVLLTGCFGGEVSVSLDHVFTDAAKRFEISFPDTFLVVAERDLPVGALMGLISLEGGDFANNVTVTSERLPEVASSLRFALANIRKAEKVLPGFDSKDVMKVEIGGEETRLHRFSIEQDDEVTEFVQVFLTDRDEGFVVTGTWAEENEVTEKMMEEMVRSFKLLVVE